MQNEIIFELYADDNKFKYSSNPKDILKFAKKIYEKLYTNKSSHLRRYMKNGVLKNFVKFTAKHCVSESLFK